MNNKTTNIKRTLFRAIIASLSGLSIIAGGISFSKNLSCSDPYLQSYFAAHPENSPKQISTDTYAYMYNLALQSAQQTATQIGGYVIDPGLENVIISDCTRRIGVYQGYINSLQVQYQNAMATGNVAYAQQCLNLINAWNAKIAETNNYLAAYKLSIGK